MRKLEPRHRMAAMFLAGGCPKEDIMKKLNITAPTLSRWQHDDLFMAEVELYISRAYEIWEKEVIGFMPGLAHRLMQMTFSEKTKDKDILTLAEFAHKVKTKPELQPGVKVDINVANRSDADVRIDSLFREAGSLLRDKVLETSKQSDSTDNPVDKDGGSRSGDESTTGERQTEEDKSNS